MKMAYLLYLCTAYTAIVYPKLKYAFAAWDPYLQKDIVKLERIQRKAARFCTKNYHPTTSITEMLQDWTSLELRRPMTQLTLLYKMSRGQFDIDVNTYLYPHAELRTREAIIIDSKIIISKIVNNKITSL